MIIPQSVREEPEEAHLTSSPPPPHITMEESQVIKAVRPDHGSLRPSHSHSTAREAEQGQGAQAALFSSSLLNSLQIES